MSLLEEAEKYETKKKREAYLDVLEEKGLNESVDFYLVCQYLGVNKEELDNPETRKKLEGVYEWGQNHSSDPFAFIKEMDSMLGGKTSVERLYAYSRVEDKEKISKKKEQLDGSETSDNIRE